MRDPIFMYDQAVVPAGQRRNLILKNPNRDGMIVEEIRFHYITTATGINNFNYYNPIDLIRAKIQIGQMNVTAGRDVPLALLCPLTDDANYWLGQGSSPNGGRASLTWKLPKPMYLPRNGQITFDFIFADDFSDTATLAIAKLTTVTIDVAMVGYAAAGAVPGTVAMPYATLWQTPTLGAATPYKLQSGVGDLKNAARYPLNVSHMGIVGMDQIRAGAQYSIGDVLGDAQGQPRIAAALAGVIVGNNTNVGFLNFSAQDGGLRMQIRDQRGGFIVRDPTPLALIFAMTERVCKMNTVLAPNGYYIATLSGMWNPDFNVGTIDTFYSTLVRLTFGLLGHHEVPVTDMGVAL